MFIISLTYIKPLSEVEKYLQAHQEFLDDCYKNQFFIASGPKVPRTGGVILAKLSDKALLEALIERDPFKAHGLARYEITEFIVNKGWQELLGI